MISKARKFALYFIKMVLKGALFENAINRFRLLAVNPEHKQQLCQYITYDSFKRNMVNKYNRIILTVDSLLWTL